MFVRNLKHPVIIANCRHSLKYAQLIYPVCNMNASVVRSGKYYTNVLPCSLLVLLNESGIHMMNSWYQILPDLTWLTSKVEIQVILNTWPSWLTSILQCSFETFGSWIRMSQVLFLKEENISIFSQLQLLNNLKHVYILTRKRCFCIYILLTLYWYQANNCNEVKFNIFKLTIVSCMVLALHRHTVYIHPILLLVYMHQCNCAWTRMQVLVNFPCMLTWNWLTLSSIMPDSSSWSQTVHTNPIKTVNGQWPNIGNK